VLARHRESLAAGAPLEQTDLFGAAGVQLNIMDSHHAEIMEQLTSVDINALTPLDALNLVAELKKKAQ
jgi:hypothetical protein